MTKDEILSKIEYEGGIAETIVGYGLGIDNLPADVPMNVRIAWRTISLYQESYTIITDWLYHSGNGGADVSADSIRPIEPSVSCH